MILTFAALVLVAAVAYFHYVQGFFSATISAILAVISAAIALGYYEPVMRLVQGKAGDQGAALAIVALFGIVYTVLRTIFDTAVPGNIRLPVLLDKIGAGIAGLFAGIFAVGILIIAVQTLPFGPSIAGYSRYALDPEEAVQLPTGRQAKDSFVYNQLKSGSFDPQDKTSLLLPVDDIVVNVISHLSDGGSLAGPVDMMQVHPDLLDELFAQRLGIQTGAKHTAINVDHGQNDVEMRGLYTIAALPQAEGEIAAIRKSTDLAPLRSDQSKVILIARLSFAHNAADEDNSIRFSTAAVRLVANQTNYTPIGTLDLTGTPLVRVNHPDDFLIVPADGAVDFVFLVPRDDLGLASDKKNETAPLQIGQDVFIEAKRSAAIDLSGQAIKREVPPPPGTTLRRKTGLPAAKPLVGLIAAPAQLASEVPFDLDSLQVSADLFTDINVGRYDGDSATVTFASGNAVLREKKFVKLEIDSTRSISLMNQGDFLVRQFWSPPNMRIVQAVGSPPSRSYNGWEWADNLNKFELLDAAGNLYRPCGAWAKIKQGTSDRMVARYDAVLLVSDVPRSEGRPTDVWIAFLVPQNSTLREFRYNGQRVRSLDQQV